MFITPNMVGKLKVKIAFGDIVFLFSGGETFSFEFHES